MNGVIAGISYRALLGRRRIWLLALLPVALVAIAGLLRYLAGFDEEIAITLMENFAIATMLPLLGLIAGTGVIAPEIDDGTIVHLLAKPISRPVIAQTKFAVAASMLALFAAVPTLVAAYLLVGFESGIALGFAVGALAGGIAYAAVFMLLGVLSRHAVTIGVAYALIWETAIGTFVPGARQYSIQHWARSVADEVSSSAFQSSEVALSFAAPALIVVTVGAVVWAGQRLRSFSLTGDE
ncbi:ABC-2 type transport system permease protein [Streptosporangium becharense]|uniref:ABC-2 type transport system permease protein n=1 Tax=Streptosporangium becharense TaxID=1816182 RepID=A0A7W9IF38_9ACTN|nr:ABC transporter permease [Streptosporangium becharense]MBB2909469.1 ABC-2 type transport system permease protein [Streptosporangium becharense]MBB5819574.1 ABC-2 type transport system permease protein [Streptosporangium becharense]